MGASECEEKMTKRERVVYVVSADPPTTQALLAGLMSARGDCQLPIAISIAQAHHSLVRAIPVVILLDESAVEFEGPDRGAALEAAVAGLVEFAPVVAIAAPERQGELAFLISSGAIDFVARAGNFIPIAVGMVERRLFLAERPEPHSLEAAGRPTSDFGAVLRHEVNNPLTGILGNAELLVAEFRKKNGAHESSSALERARTIAELAVRLREAVRRISDDWETRHDQARSA
jgi:signal transduction histidine kinase